MPHFSECCLSIVQLGTQSVTLLTTTFAHLLGGLRFVWPFGRSGKPYFREYLWPFVDEIERDIVERQESKSLHIQSCLVSKDMCVLSVSHSLPLDMLNFDLRVAFCTLETFPASSWTLVLAIFQTKGNSKSLFCFKGKNNAYLLLFIRVLSYQPH